MSTSTPETTIDADPNVPVVRIVREFDAPPPRVFACQADPELFARWCGPDDVAMTVETWDFRTGGSWRFHHMRGADTYSFYGSFHEVRPDELIVQTFTFCGVPDGVALERLRFVALGGGRTRLEASSLVDSFEGRDAMLSSGMDVGVRDGYAKLDAVLATG